MLKHSDRQASCSERFHQDLFYNSSFHNHCDFGRYASFVLESLILTTFVCSLVPSFGYTHSMHAHQRLIHYSVARTYPLSVPQAQLESTRSVNETKPREYEAEASLTRSLQNFSRMLHLPPKITVQVRFRASSWFISKGAIDNSEPAMMFLELLWPSITTNLKID